MPEKKKSITDYIDFKFSLGNIIVIVTLIGSIFVYARRVDENGKLNDQQNVDIDTLNNRLHQKDIQIQVILNQIKNEQQNFKQYREDQKDAFNDLMQELKELRKEIRQSK